MDESTELLRIYVRGIRELSKARSVSLFVPASADRLGSTILIQDGDLPPVPELVNVDAAKEFHQKMISRSAEPPAASISAPAHQAPRASPEYRLVQIPSRRPLLIDLKTTELPSLGRRNTDREDPATRYPVAAWIGLRFEESRDRSSEASHLLELPRETDGPIHAIGWGTSLLALGGALAWHARRITEILNDPVSGLPVRTHLLASLRHAMVSSRETRNTLSLLLINPDDFVTVNERFGREAGDRTMREIAQRLCSILRETDPVAKYGGAVFAAILLDTSLDDATTVARKVLKAVSEAAFLDGAIRLGFSIGVASYDPAERDVEQPPDLIRRADQALYAAKRAGGGRWVVWQPGSDAEEAGNLDRLSGIFTGNMTKDYRNMTLLWETVTLLAGSAVFEELAAQATEKLYSTFKPDRIGLFDWSNGEAPRLIESVCRRDTEAGLAVPGKELPLREEQRTLLEEARKTRQVIETQFPEDPSFGETGVPCYAVPLVAAEECLGCIYIEGRVDNPRLDSSDLIFLKALASQLAIAADRARLTEQEKLRQEQERKHLRAEVRQLRQALQEAKLEYRSEQLEAVLSTARRVAPTDATVLITGESGTGKELIARTIHQLSPRSRKPFVIVDCSSIPTTLIESELFGHERGAYTGAQQRRTGRLVEAHEGSLLLDEIGELPLEVQGRLLRFVQEKQLTPVGASRPQAVNVRVIAATNRDLLDEVRLGRFREDLYFRLNVVRLAVPPLRERPDDILHLVNHYIRTYSLLYNKVIKRLTPEVEALLVRHSWPGNVRELQNRLQQAVILCDSQELGSRELGFSEESGALATPSVAPLVWEQAERSAEPFSASSQRASVASPPGTDTSDTTPSLFWESLGSCLEREIETALADGHPLVPLGKWLRDDLVVEADAAAEGVASRAARAIQIPVTTFRRLRDKAAEETKAGSSPRSTSWADVRGALASLVRCPELRGADLLGKAENILLDIVLSQTPKDVGRRAALLGVTAPTYRRRVAQAVSDIEKNGA